ncbi:MAG: phosphate ABC transporter substrate-binding protein [Bryobacterales bacterium]|nr:phosphate ABC transporter substrate-binding protein [Bryobacterales bacterium]
MARVVWVLAAAVPVWAELAVVANASVGVNEISADELKRVFLGAKSSLQDGSAVEPVLMRSGAAHDAFLKDYVGKTDAALRNHFKSLVFTGRGSMPKSFSTDADVVAYVAKTKGAIGYVGNAAAAAGVKRLAVK